MLNSDEIESFEQHEAFSDEDLSGKDFTATKEIGGKKITKHFGVTISKRRASHSQKMYPNVPQVHIHHLSTDWQIKEALMTLFPITQPITEERQ